MNGGGRRERGKGDLGGTESRRKKAEDSRKEVSNWTGKLENEEKKRKKEDCTIM